MQDERYVYVLASTVHRNRYYTGSTPDHRGAVARRRALNRISSTPRTASPGPRPGTRSRSQVSTVCPQQGQNGINWDQMPRLAMVCCSDCGARSGRKPTLDDSSLATRTEGVSLHDSQPITGGLTASPVLSSRRRSSSSLRSRPERAGLGCRCVSAIYSNSSSSARTFAVSHWHCYSDFEIWTPAHVGDSAELRPGSMFCNRRR